MDRRKLFKRVAYLIFFLFILNVIANKLYWYSSIWWFDMPMHLLGGFWIGLAVLWLFFKQTWSFSLIVKIILSVLIVGIGWEIFEALVNNVVADNPFNTLDTVSDIFFDLAGGSLACLYFAKRMSKIVPDQLNKVE